MSEVAMSPIKVSDKSSSKKKHRMAIILRIKFVLPKVCQHKGKPMGSKKYVFIRLQFWEYREKATLSL